MKTPPEIKRPRRQVQTGLRKVRTAALEICAPPGWAREVKALAKEAGWVLPAFLFHCVQAWVYMAERKDAPAGEELLMVIPPPLRDLRARRAARINPEESSG